MNEAGLAPAFCFVLLVASRYHLSRNTLDKESATSMQILIFGAGAVGCFLGAQLARGGHRVSLVGRPALADAVRARGLRLRLASGEVHLVQAQAFTSLHEAFGGSTSYDWIAFTMKAYDTVDAIFDLQPLLPAGVPVVSFQNGIGNEDSLRSAFGAEQVAAATLTTPVSMPEPGLVVEERARGAAVATDTPAALPVLDALRDSPLEVTAIPDSAVLKWSKLLLNITGNALPAILDMLPGEVFAHPSLFRVELTCLHEALAMMRLMGIPPVNLPGAPARTFSRIVRATPPLLLRPLLRRLVAGGRGDKAPSLLAALRRGDRRTEVAWLNGAVVQAADRLKRYAPANHALALTLSDIASGRIPWESFRHNPEMLLAAVRTATGDYRR